MLKAVVLDFDGVILESVDIKTQAFREMFKDYPEHLERIVKLHLDNGGMSRFEKFNIIYRDYLEQSVDERELKRLGEIFSRLIYREVLRCPFVPGAYQFLYRRAQDHKMFIASGTPQDEVQNIVRLRGLDRFFRGVYGSPRAKADILRGILRENQFLPHEAVFIGDAMTDYRGALSAGVGFIGRIGLGEDSSFPALGVVAVIQDLCELDRQWSSLLDGLFRK